MCAVLREYNHKRGVVMRSSSKAGSGGSGGGGSSSLSVSSVEVMIKDGVTPKGLVGAEGGGSSTSGGGQDQSSSSSSSSLPIMMVAIVDCLWDAVVGDDDAECDLMEQGGVEGVMDLVERSSPRAMKYQVRKPYGGGGGGGDGDGNGSKGSSSSGSGSSRSNTISSYLTTFLTLTPSLPLFLLFLLFLPPPSSDPGTRSPLRPPP